MEDDKKLLAAALVVIFGGNASGIINAVNPNVRSDPFTGSQGKALAERIHDLEEWKRDHVKWGRDRSIISNGQYERHEAQIQELYRRLP